MVQAVMVSGARRALKKVFVEVMKIPIKGNKAVLVSSATCRACGKCCKEFTVDDNLDMAIRFAWLDSDKIDAEDTPFQERWGNIKKVTYKFPCKKLVCKDGKYSCVAYDEERPDFCATYPDHIFYGVESWNKEKIQRLLDECRNDCPGLKKVCVRDVIKMLDEL